MKVQKIIRCGRKGYAMHCWNSAVDMRVLSPGDSTTEERQGYGPFPEGEARPQLS